MNKKKIFLALLPVFLLTTLLVGCGNNNETRDKKTLELTSSTQINTMDSSLNTDMYGAQNLTNTMSGLYRYDGDKLEPDLAKSVVKPTNDGKTYTFELRKSKWSNGKYVTADDFVYAWRRIVDPQTASQYAYIYSGVKNADDIMIGKNPVDSLGIKALGKYKLQVDLDQPIPYFNALMTSSQFFPLYKPTVDAAGKQYGLDSSKMVFNGPFKLVNWKVGNMTWTEVKNDKYWNKNNVKLDTVTYDVIKDSNTGINLYDTHMVDRFEKIGGDMARQVKTNKDFSIDKQPSTGYIELNQAKNPILKNQKIRQAISLSFDRKELTENVQGNTAIIDPTVVPSGISKDPTTGKDFTENPKLDSLKQYSEYNPKKAAKLWKEGLKETGGKNLTFTLLGDNTSVKQSEFLQSQMEKNLPGINIKIENVPFKNRLQRSTSGDFDMVVSLWNGDYPDPITFLNLFTTGNPQNNGKYENKEYDKLINDSSTIHANDPVARNNDLIQATKIITEEQGVIPLYQTVQANLTRPNLKNYEVTPVSLYNLATTYKK
ncbi:peptide ABC transporter substrate-binding protein [Lactobacillus terrae]|uniref:peptide ABC transporter substrate-binding protein n=1 Tax=Lactobacillus terrae TaxID=2269374 RepID=UPI000C1B6230|nr:peptide ABC transporter substrate-binding protein [Lactobacillus terrae]